MNLDDLSLEDRAAVEDFTAFLSGAPACLLCLTPSAQCGRPQEPCCPNCLHGRIQTVEGPPRSEMHARPSLLMAERRG